MINTTTISAQDLLTLCTLAKTIKAAFAAYFIIEEDRIIVYGTQDYMFTSLSRIIVPNTTKLRCSFAVEMKEGESFTSFCKLLVPYTDVIFKSNMLLYNGVSVNVSLALESLFIEKKRRLNDIIETESVETFDVDSDTILQLKELLSRMKSASGQRFFQIKPGYLITIFSGFIPVNKNDTLTISVVSGDTWFMCKYEILKKKTEPVNIFIKYRRL